MTTEAPATAIESGRRIDIVDELPPEQVQEVLALIASAAETDGMSAAGTPQAGYSSPMFCPTTTDVAHGGVTTSAAARASRCTAR
ncbi:hypothetical protein P6B95_11455 [Streptomyces atratus]|uniref:hypothetical protein n=1 Tax=Streptomyces atratus TaxID=1893 RepID=UPI00167073E1|nr:hypothetical protein [Streptomyces atratus]WPW27929.1 hypothetical protein P6B95_11455 [Streptomyces atratus]GGT22995.1 hypothetical protein GCM10010207_22910 [Streptomyces atratus]